MAIVKVHNKVRNVTYVYESTSYWDKELKQPRSHRKLIGRIDPITGEIVPTGKRQSNETVSSATSNSDTNYKALYDQLLSTISQKNMLIDELQNRLSVIEAENKSLRRTIQKARNVLNESAEKVQCNG